MNSFGLLILRLFLVVMFCVGPANLVFSSLDKSFGLSFHMALAKGGGDGGDGGDGDGGEGGDGGDGDNSNGATSTDRGGFDPDEFIDLFKASLFRGAIAKVIKKLSSIEITYRDGWKEKIISGRYFLIDPKNRVVVKRPAKKSDTARLNATIKSKKPWIPPEVRN